MKILSRFLYNILLQKKHNRMLMSIAQAVTGIMTPFGILSKLTSHYEVRNIFQSIVSMFVAGQVYKSQTALNIAYSNERIHMYNKSTDSIKSIFLIIFIHTMLASTVITVILFHKFLPSDILNLIYMVIGILTLCVKDIISREFGSTAITL